MAKACRLLGEAAAEGAELAVLPETFVSLYPSNAWARELVDGCAGDVSRMHAAFRTSSELELAFWEAAWASSR